MFTDEIIERRNAVLKDWPAFVKQPSSHLIAEFIERDQTDLPSNYCPWAPGIVIASDYLLQAANYHPKSRGPNGWTLGQPDVFTKVIYGNRLLVRGCGEFWTVEREIDEALAFPYGPVPIFTRTRQAAMRLAEYCQPKPREDEYRPFPKPRGVASPLRWIVSTPSGIMWM
jgi:hypothetical protein